MNYTNQNLYSDLLIILQVVDNLDYSEKDKVESVLDSLVVRFYQTNREIQSKILKSKTKQISELIRTILYLGINKRKVNLLKRNLHELLILVQAEIEKVNQPILFKEVA